MKQRHKMAEPLTCGVASRAEAWIETAAAAPVYLTGEVASRAEAWIEPRGMPLGRIQGAGRLPCGGVD